MESTIFKYPVMGWNQEWNVSVGAKFIGVAVEGNFLLVYAIVNKAELLTERRTFHAAVTYDNLSMDELEYIGTTAFKGEARHVFVEKI